MRVIITGARGFLGTHLTQALLARDALVGRSNPASAIDELVLLDVTTADARHAGDPRVTQVVGSVADAAQLEALAGPGVDAVFALGATLTSQAEADFAQGMEINLQGMIRLLEVCRLSGHCPRFVYTSSIAAFGGPLPELVTDDVPRTPQTSYGTQKAINELLIDDYSRRGFVDGRALRLPVVVVRPPGGGVNPAISDRVAALVREPLAGRDVVCPLRRDTLIPVASARAVAAALLSVHDLPASSFGHTRALNLHSLSVRIGALIEAVQTIGRRRPWRTPVGVVHVSPDPALQAIVDQWPRRFESQRARALGVLGDASVELMIDHYIRDFLEPEASGHASTAK